MLFSETNNHVLIEKCTNLDKKITYSFLIMFAIISNIFL